MKQKCPICHKIIAPVSQEETKAQDFYPFCSERCKLIDLGAWLDTDYKILSPQKSRESDQDFEMPESDENH
jgi:endogenous inhibitor of DNA gyrase (YacG/DUF329 family)